MKKLTKQELEKLYYSKRNKDVCKELGISEPTLNYLLKKSGIKLKGKGGGKTGEAQRKIEIVDEDLERVFEEQREVDKYFEGR